LDVAGFHVSNISIVVVVALFVNCVALNTPIRFAEVGVFAFPSTDVVNSVFILAT
jgi:hypothetical protein